MNTLKQISNKEDDNLSIINSCLPLEYHKFYNPLNTDFYQITMIYAYWKHERHKEIACFNLFYRNNPFNLKVIYVC